MNTNDSMERRTTCRRGLSDCDCDPNPLEPGERIRFHCITHDEDVEATVMHFVSGHTYRAAADCGVALVSITQVERTKYQPLPERTTP